MTDTTREITISGESFVVNTPYAEGHVLTAVEAKALNQTRCENLRNNLAKAIKDAKEAGSFDHAEAQKQVAAYDAEYTFSVPGSGGGRRALDPVEKEARKIARSMIKQKLEAGGGKIGDVDKDVLNEKIEEVSQLADVIKAAKKVISEREKIAGIDISGI